MGRQAHAQLLSLAAAALATLLLLVPVDAVTPLHKPRPPLCPITEPFSPSPLTPTPASTSGPEQEPDLHDLAAAARRDLAAARRAVAALAHGAAGTARARAVAITVASARGARGAVHRAAVCGRKAAAVARGAAERQRADMARREAQARRNGRAWLRAARERLLSARKTAGVVAVRAQTWTGRQWATAMAVGSRWWVWGGALALRSRKGIAARGGVLAGQVDAAVTVAMQRGNAVVRAAGRKAAAVAPRPQDATRVALPLLGQVAFVFAGVYAGCACLIALLRALLEDTLAQPVGLALYAIMRAQLASLRRQNHEDSRTSNGGISKTELRTVTEQLMAETEARPAGNGGSGNAEAADEANARLAASAVPKASLCGGAALRPTLLSKKPRMAPAEMGDGIDAPSYHGRRRPLQRKAPTASRRKLPIRVRYSDSMKPSNYASDTHAIDSTYGEISVPDRSNLYVTERRSLSAHERKVPDREVIVIDD